MTKQEKIELRKKLTHITDGEFDWGHKNLSTLHCLWKMELERRRKEVAEEAAMSVAESGSGHSVRRTVRLALQESKWIQEAQEIVDRMQRESDDKFRHNIQVIREEGRKSREGRL